MKKGILLLVIAVFALVNPCMVFASELTDDYFDIAANYYNSNNLAKSLEYLDLILVIEPDNCHAKTLRDKISPPPVDNSEAVEATAKVLNNSSKPESVVIVDTPQENLQSVIYDSDYYNNKGQEFYYKKEFDSAVEYFQKAIAVNKRNAQAYNNLAMAYWCKNNPSLAVNYFKKANEVNRSYTQPLVNLSNLYKRLGDKKRQVEYLKKAIKINCNDYMAYYWLGDYYRSEEEYQFAITNYKEAIKINSKFAASYLSLAMCFFEVEEFNYCLFALEQYRELNPDSDYSYFLSARANLAICNYTAAKNYIEKALLMRDCSEYKFESAKIDYYLGEYDAALALLQDILSIGDNAEAFNYVGLCNYKKKNIEVAIANFNKAIDADGLRPIYYYNLAQCYKSLGDKKNYVKYVNTATRITPVNYQDFIDLSYIYFDNNNSSYAINSLNEAIKRYPSVKSLYLSKLKIYEAIGDNLNYNETRDLIETRFNKR